MKLLIYFFITISVFAQDTSSVKLSNGKQLKTVQIAKLHIGEVEGKTKSLLEMRSSRLWKNSSDLINKSRTNSLTTIEFKKKEPNFIDSDLFLIVAGSAVAFGATAAYFKLESDASYDKYKLTNNKSHLTKTDRYDLYSGISLGLMEINFGYLVYKFLTD